MVTQNPRLNVVLDEKMYKQISQLANEKGLSRSLVARELLRDALERHEDTIWHIIAEDRDQSYSTKESISHKDLWEE